MYAEVIYETGSKSVMFVADEAELLEGLSAHHARATSGEAGGPTGAPAERISRVEIYDHHPDELNADQTVSSEVALEELKGFLKGKDAVNVHELANAVRELSSPVVPFDEQDRLASMYKMTATKTLTTGWEGK